MVANIRYFVVSQFGEKCKPRSIEFNNDNIIIFKKNLTGRSGSWVIRDNEPPNIKLKYRTNVHRIIPTVRKKKVKILNSKTLEKNLCIT